MLIYLSKIKSERLVEMAKLLLLLVFVCFQVSSQEELANTEVDKATDENSTDVEILDGEDETQWKYQKEEDLDDEWTEEDEKWVEKIQALLQDSDEDYDDDDEEFEKLMKEIDKHIEKTYEDVLGDDDDDDDDDLDLWSDEDDVTVWIGNKYVINYYPLAQKDLDAAGKNGLNLYYSWLYRTKINDPDQKKPMVKRFSSV